MRQIKFRGISINNHEWVYGDLSIGSAERGWDESRVFIVERKPLLERFEVISETVGQFTGFLDKKGREIYEGDTVNYLNNTNENCSGRVGMYAGEWQCLSGTIGNMASVYCLSAQNKIKVTGNIHDNNNFIEGELTMSITREQAIDFLKNGIWIDAFQNALYVSFGQLHPDIQEVAKDIVRKYGYNVFEELRSFSHVQEWVKIRDGDGLALGRAYRLRSDYEDKQKEPEYEYLEIFINHLKQLYQYTPKSYTHSSNEIDLFASEPASTANSIVGFHCYANADKEHLNINYFDPATCRYVVLKKKGNNL